MTQLAVSHRRRHPLVPIARVASLLAIVAACHVAQAAVIQTPYCLLCAVNNMPAAGDELVIRGFFVRFGADNLVSQGLLTNSAYNLVSSRNLHAEGGIRNHNWFTNTGSLTVAGPGAPVLTNHGLFSNSGTLRLMALMDNKAGRVVNSGTLQVQGGNIVNHGGATFTNNANFSLTDGRLTNLSNAVFNNLGDARGHVNSALFNEGTVNNQAGRLQMAIIGNSGQMTNSAGATLDVGSTLVNETGGTLVNRGVINVSTDGRFALHQGSAYDFQGGTLNIAPLARLYLNRDFTIGNAQGGQVNLDYDSRVFNTATLRVANTQVTIGNISNTGTVINDGDWQHEGALTGSGALRNNGAFTAKGYVRTTAFTQDAGQTVVEGDVGLGQAVVDQGTVEVKAGGLLSADTLTLNGGLLATEGEVRMGSLFVDQDGWLDLAEASLALTGDFIDGSLVNGPWQTGQASLIFEGAGLHRFGVGLGGHDWASLTLDGAGSYEFFGGGTLNVGAFTIEGGDLSLLSSIAGDATIFYDPTLAANAYLNGQSYNFGQGSGQLLAFQPAPAMMLARALPSMSVTAVPEAEHGAMVLAGLAVVLGLRRRRAVTP